MESNIGTIGTLHSGVTQLAELPDLLHIKNYRKWPDYSEEIDKIIEKLKAYRVGFKEKTSNLYLREKGFIYVWKQIVMDIEAATKDPAAGKNWNDLPSELAKKCIAKMDFMTSLALRSTAKRESKLVDETLKISPSRVFISAGSILRADFILNRYSFKISTQDSDTALASFGLFLRAVDRMEMGYVEYHEHYSGATTETVNSVLRLLEKYPSFKFTEFQCRWKGDNRIPFHLAEHCTTDLKLLKVEYLLDLDIYERFLAVPQFMRASEMNFHAGDGALLAIARFWIDQGLSARRVVRCAGETPVGKIFAEEFKDRIVHVSHHWDSMFERTIITSIRIKTNDPNTHIVLHEPETVRLLKLRKMKLVAASENDVDGDYPDASPVIDIDVPTWLTYIENARNGTGPEPSKHSFLCEHRRRRRFQ